jgi:hypothetical protein
MTGHQKEMIMATRNRKPTQKQETPQRTEPTLFVIEHGLTSDELPILERLKALELIPGDTLYLTVPKYELHTDAIDWLSKTFQSVAPLNVGTNPKLTNHDARTRTGYLCVR